MGAGTCVSPQTPAGGLRITCRSWTILLGLGGAEDARARHKVRVTVKGTTRANDAMVRSLLRSTAGPGLLLEPSCFVRLESAEVSGCVRRSHRS